MTLIYFVLILGIIVLVHELGHFIAAKIFGVHVYEFSIGMGPKIWGTKEKKGKTVYSIRIFPIGGFVSLAGEDPTEEENVKEKVKKENLLYNKPIWQRCIIMIAGVFNNFVLAIILFYAIAIFNGTPNMKPIVQKLDVDYPLYQEGLREGDKILKINDNKISNLDDVSLFITLGSGKDKELKFRVLRDDKELEIKALPKKVFVDANGEEVAEGTKDSIEAYRYGITFMPEKEEGLIPLLKFPFEKIKSLIKQMGLVLFYLITGKMSISTLSGPIGIYSLVGDVTQANVLLNLSTLIAVFCVNVGFINILPFPAFDGGHVLFLIIEKIRGKQMNPKVLNTINMIGFALLMLLMLVITISDILKLFTK